MSLRRAFSTLALSLLVVGCGQANFGLAGRALPAAGPRAMGADGYDKPVVLEDFRKAHQFYSFAPEQHLFFAPLVFTLVGLDGGSNVALEVLAPAGEQKTRKGHYMGFGFKEYLFLKDFGGEDPDKVKPAPHVRLNFRWNVNAPQTADAAIFAEATYILVKRTPVADANGKAKVDAAGDPVFEESRFAIAYAWTNQAYCKDQVIKGVISGGGDSIPLRILVARTDAGLNQPCGANVLDEMSRKAITESRYLEKDLARIDAVLPFDPTTDLTAGATRSNCAEAGKLMAAAPSNPLNENVVGIYSLGAGAEMPSNICAHSIVDDFTMELKWKP